jgi:hypothetical protein
MNITRVEYRALRSFGDYSNQEVGAVAEVSADETADAALATLRTWVDGQLGASEDAAGLRQSVAALEDRQRRAENATVRAERKYGRLRELLGRHGVELPLLAGDWYERDDDPPF